MKTGQLLGITDEKSSKTLLKIPAIDTKKIMYEIEMLGAVKSSPVVANGVLYVKTAFNLYAIGPKVSKSKAREIPLAPTKPADSGRASGGR